MKNDNDYESIYKGNRQKLINYCISRGQSRDKAEDIAQEALKRLFENWLEVKECEERQIVHWLRKAVNNIIHEQIRQDYKHNTVNLDDVEPFLSDNFDIDRNILDEEYLNSIEKCLDEDDRKLFVLQFIEMEDSKSIAEKFGVNDQALRTRKSRLKARIVDIMEKT